MNEIKDPASLAWADIASNTALLAIFWYNTNFSETKDRIGLLIVSLLIGVSIVYASQLLLIKRYYYRYRSISGRFKVIFHISRIIHLLFSLLAVSALANTFYHSDEVPGYVRDWELKFWAMLASILVTVVLNLIIFFKGWRLLKMVKKPYLDEFMASVDSGG